MSEHTEGPWEWRAGPVGSGYIVVYSPSYRAKTDADHVVCELRAWVRPSPDADRDLICAAPEMLSVLRVALNELIQLYEDAYPDDESDNDTTVAIDAIRAVIAKAEGRGE